MGWRDIEPQLDQGRGSGENRQTCRYPAPREAGLQGRWLIPAIFITRNELIYYTYRVPTAVSEGTSA